MRRMVMPRGEVGRTRLLTRRERRRRAAALLLAVAGALVCAAAAAAVLSWLAGTGFTLPHVGLRPPVGGPDGGLLGLPRDGHPVPASRAPGFPLTLAWPASPLWSAVVGLPLWLVWLRMLVRPVTVRLGSQTRHRGLAHPAAVRAVLGARAVRRAGRFTLPSTPRWARWWFPITTFGFCLGHPRGATRRRVWADWEQRIRIVARQGWGKTFRLLVPIIRDLPGPAMISSIEPGIFEATVIARQYRRPMLRWRWLTRLAADRLPTREYPVAVLDFSDPEIRFAAGWPRVRWSPILGCTDATVAYRRAAGLVAGVESHAASQRGSDSDKFFRDSATEVLAAWLHAADLGRRDVDDLLAWLRRPTDPTPSRILRDDPRADPAAALNLAKHLDPAAAKTTSGVERYLVLAMTSMLTGDGRELCGRRDDEQFDMTGFIEAGGTLYLLADANRIDRARPLLSLFAAEMFLAAETAALRTRQRRLPLPFIAVLDELRYGITPPNLPYVAAAQRKYGISFVYAVQSSAQEQAVYGVDAAPLRAGMLSIYGGIDIDSARELTERAGTTPVVTPTRGPGRNTEQIQLQDALTIGDQQQLADGEATIITRGLAPFLAWAPSTYEQPRRDREIRAEADSVARTVAGARERDRAIRRSEAAAAALGMDVAPSGPNSPTPTLTTITTTAKE